MYQQKSVNIFQVYLRSIFLKTTASRKSSTECVKVSYSCTKNMKTIIINHNKNILGKKPLINASTCNCRNKEGCPLNGQYQIGEVVHEGTLSSNQPNYKENNYFGIAEESFKGSLYNHNLSFRNEFYKTTQNFLDNSGKSRWRITLRNNLENYQKMFTI